MLAYFTYNFVGKKLGESSLFFRMSLHLLTVSNRRNVSPTLNKVARHLAIRRRVGGPGAPCMCLVNCSTNFCWHPFMSLFKFYILKTQCRCRQEKKKIHTIEYIFKIKNY